MKLMGMTAAYATRIGQYSAKYQTSALKDSAVSLVHQIIGLLQTFTTAMKGIGIFHTEFTSTHYTKSRTALIAKFSLYLIEVSRKLFVTANFIAH